MELLDLELSTIQLLCAGGIGVAAGFVKGVVGFAMPLVFLSGLTLFLPPELALAGLILPTLLTNLQQSLRQGFAAAWQTVRQFRFFLLAGGLTLVTVAQFVLVLPERLLVGILGVMVTTFVVLQLSGVRFQLRRQTARSDALVGAATGVFGGMAGVWGPPTVAYLTALDTQKGDQMRIQGVIYGLGAVALLGAHLGSGVLNTATLPFSVALVIPAVFGMWLGGLLGDRIDQQGFRRATLIVLLVAGLNLIRRALF